MGMDRRGFLRIAPAVAGAATIACGGQVAPRSEWEEVRSQFDLADGIADFSALLIASHPRPVREAIERHSRALNQNPTAYLQAERVRQDDRALQAAARYIGGRPEDIALTDSTTMGLALVYNGFHLRPDEEFLVSDHNYYSTQESVRLASVRTGAQVRSFPLYRDIASVSAAEIVANVVSAVQPQTRVLALTWVHSSTGLKLPIERIADRIRELNQQRPAGQRVLLCVDGVHGFGVEDVHAAQLGCDFFVAGCHKWLFGPRGTGIVWGSEEGWKAVSPTIPTFMDNTVRRAWIVGEQPAGQTTGGRLSPGGFKPFEHQWALAEAFGFHEAIGKSKIASRTQALSARLKDGLATIPGVIVITPRSEELSAGIVCFQVEDMEPRAVVDRLRERNIVATTTPYLPTYPRLTPSIRNSEEEIETVLREVRRLTV